MTYRYIGDRLVVGSPQTKSIRFYRYVGDKLVAGSPQPKFGSPQSKSRLHAPYLLG